MGRNRTFYFALKYIGNKKTTSFTTVREYNVDPQGYLLPATAHVWGLTTSLQMPLSIQQKRKDRMYLWRMGDETFVLGQVSDNMLS